MSNPPFSGLLTCTAVIRLPSLKMVCRSVLGKRCFGAAQRRDHGEHSENLFQFCDAHHIHSFFAEIPSIDLEAISQAREVAFKENGQRC